MSKPKGSVLLLSTGRTGTQFFARLINKFFPEIYAVHASPYSTVINVLCNAYSAKLCPRVLIKWVWKLFKEKEISNCGSHTYIDSNNHLYQFPQLYGQLYPNLRILHIVRDPRDYIKSHLNWAKGRKKSYVANFIIPFWQPNGFLMGEYTLIRWLRLSQLQRFAWIWCYKNNEIEKIESIGVPYCRIRFEDVFNKFDKCSFIRAIEFMGLDFNNQLVDEIKVRKNESTYTWVKKWEDWSDKDCAQVDNICGSMMKKYSYGNEALWIEKVEKGKKLIYD